jgi:hypothetical protein
VAGHGVHDGLLAQIPDVNGVIDAAAVNLVAGFGQRDACDRKLCLQILQRVFLARVPDADATVVAAADE